MGFELTIQRLTGLRADLSAERERQEERVADLVEKQKDIDTALVALGFDADVNKIRGSTFGENAHATLEVLRRAPRTLTSLEIAQQVLILRGLDFENRRLVSKMMIRTRIILRQFESDGIAISRPGKYPEFEWSLGR